jgi:hypothetical protein
MVRLTCEERENLNWKKEIDDALKPIIALPFDLQEILLGDLVETVKNRVAFMQSIAAKQKR